MIVILICSSLLPLSDCNEHTARAVIKHATPQSVICGLPGDVSSLTGQAGVREDEYAKIKCSI
jgi:hypothetical protein